MWIVLIAKLMLLMMVGWEHYPNSDLSKWSPLAGPCMNISHWTAICLWLYLIAEMMILTMLVVFSIFSARGHKGELSCKPYLQWPCHDSQGYKLLKKTLSSFGLIPRITLGLFCLQHFMVTFTEGLKMSLQICVHFIESDIIVTESSVLHQIQLCLLESFGL